MTTLKSIHYHGALLKLPVILRWTIFILYPLESNFYLLVTIFGKIITNKNILLYKYKTLTALGSLASFMGAMHKEDFFHTESPLQMKWCTASSSHSDSQYKKCNRLPSKRGIRQLKVKNSFNLLRPLTMFFFFFNRKKVTDLKCRTQDFTYSLSPIIHVTTIMIKVP